MWKKFLKFVALLIVALIIQHFSFVVARAERGYDAVGSEYFAFPFVMVVGCYGLGLFGDDEDDYDYEEDDYDELEDDLSERYRDVI